MILFASQSKHDHSAHTFSSVTRVLSASSLLESTEKWLSMSSCLAFRASGLISTATKCCLPGSRRSILPVAGGGGTENFWAMLCRTQQALIMLDFLFKEPSCAKPSCIKHLKRLFMEPSVVRMTLWIFAWAALKRVSLTFVGSDTGVKTCLLRW